MITYIIDDKRQLKIDKNEAARYAGGRPDDLKLLEMIDDCWAELCPLLSLRACYSILPIEISGQLDLGFTKSNSLDLSKNLTGCNHIILFAATIGAGADRLIQRYSRLSPARALCMQAVASAAIEAYCNLLNDEWTQNFAASKPRFSPGYGDFPIEMQRDIQKALQFEKIGITLTESLLMAPSKSVSAIIGIKK